MHSTILIVPGLRAHVPEHWQTHLEASWPGARSVPPLDVDKANLEARIEALETAALAIEGPLLLVAHSAGVIIAAHWARRTKRAVKAALLVTPPDLNRTLPAIYPQPDALLANGWLPVPRTPLPFPSLLAASETDELCALAAASALARDWGSRLLNLGAVGHMNPAAGYGPWPGVAELIRNLDAERA